jgi:excinuclease ABC subunit B
LVILYADNITDSMRNTIEQSNRRREIQIRYNIEHNLLPRQAQKSGSGQSLLLTQKPEDMNAYPIVEEHYAVASDVQGSYNATPTLSGKELDELIKKAREDMERAAKSLDFMAAMRYRDRMYELQKMKEEM